MFNEISNNFQVVLLARFKTFAIVKNKSVVLWWDKLVVDVGIASRIMESNLWKQNE
jgi:hypothetical protein